MGKVERLKYEKMGAKDVSYGHIDFSCAFRGNYAQHGHGWFWVQFFLNRATLGSLWIGCGSHRYRWENSKLELGYANVGEKSDRTQCAPARF